MTDRNLLPGEYAILGLLLLKPMHGYEMARYFDGDELAEVCPLEQSSLYTYLRNVEARALVRWDEERVGQRPPRKIYELTPAGRELVHRWLGEPVRRIREIRLDLLLKLYFLRQLDPAAEAELLREQVEVCETYIASLAGRSPQSDFQRLVHESKRTAAESTLAWLKAYAFERDVLSRPGRPA